MSKPSCTQISDSFSPLTYEFVVLEGPQLSLHQSTQKSSKASICKLISKYIYIYIYTSINTITNKTCTRSHRLIFDIQNVIS